MSFVITNYQYFKSWLERFDENQSYHVQMIMYSISNIIVVFFSCRSLLYTNLKKSTSPILFIRYGRRQRNSNQLNVYGQVIDRRRDHHHCQHHHLYHHHHHLLDHHALHGQPLQVCSTSPMTGWYRDGKCRFAFKKR